MLATIYPDRITVRHAKKQSIYDTYLRKLEREARPIPEQSTRNLQIKKTTLGMSPATVRKIKDSCNLLYDLTPARNIEISKNKSIFNYRLAFVTLTLPAPQKHTDIEIKNKCLNNFLNIMRSRFGLKNYLWVAELQKNENIHFHLVWDLYVHHKIVRYYWNQSLNLLGYVDEYSTKFSKMSLSQYAKHRNKPISDIKNAFAIGCRSKWRNPGTEQVVALRDKRAVASYISKYITKNQKQKEQEVDDRAESFGRAWGRSQSLSKIKFITRWDWNNIYSVLSQKADYKRSFTVKVFDYCSVWYLNVHQASQEVKKWLKKHMRLLGDGVGWSLSGINIKISSL